MASRFIKGNPKTEEDIEDDFDDEEEEQVDETQYETKVEVIENPRKKVISKPAPVPAPSPVAVERRPEQRKAMMVQIAKEVEPAIQLPNGEVTNIHGAIAYLINEVNEIRRSVG